MQISSAYSSAALSVASLTSETAAPAPAKGAQAAPVKDHVDVSDEALQSSRQATLSAESVSLSVSGAISGKKGSGIAFSLDLEYDHAALTAQASDGTSTATIAAQSTSTSSSFTLASADSSHLNAEVSKVAKEVKPLVKEFLAATGMRGGWGQVNRFLRSVA